MTSTELTSQVSSGQDLMELLKSKNISPEQLSSVLNSGDIVDTSM